MTTITLTVTGAKAQARVTEPLTAGMVGLPVAITWNDAWDGLTKNLVCMCREDARDPGVIRTILNVGQSAVVAHEVMLPGRELYLGIEGRNASGNLVVPTTWAYCGKISPGANADGDPSADPQFPVWAQIQNDVKALKEDVEALKNRPGDDNEEDSGGNANLTVAQAEALHGMFKVCAYDDSQDVSGAYAAFLSAFGLTDSGKEEPDEPEIPEVTLESISATYSGGEVEVGTDVSALTGIVVKAHYSDGTSATVTDYTLSGTIAEGSNVITVSYDGKTATFTVTGVVESSFVPVHTEGVSSINWFTKNQSYVETGGVDANDTWNDTMVEPDNGYKVKVTNISGLTGIGGTVYTLAWPLTSGKKYNISIENIGTIETFGSVWVGKLATLPVKGEIVTSENTVDTVVHSFKFLKAGESASAEYTAGDNEWLFAKFNDANRWTIIAEVSV